MEHGKLQSDIEFNLRMLSIALREKAPRAVIEDIKQRQHKLLSRTRTL